MNRTCFLESILCCLILILLVPGLIHASTGKIRGIITDRNNGEPLMMANIIIQGTRIGAASDKNGEYILLNVPTGKHTLVVTYVGYKKLTVSEIIVNTGLTTFRDFEMSRIILKGQHVVVLAEKPLIDKSETNEIHYLRSEDIQQMPIRGITAAITSMAGVVDDDGIHVRGGRSYEMAYYVDGVNTSHVNESGFNWDDNQMISLINNAIEEVQLQTGGFTAEYGGRMSGITVATSKTGKQNYHLTAEAISDDFWAVKDDAGSYEIMGIDKLYSFGYNTYTLTASGPLWTPYKNIRFFVAGESWNRLSSPTWFEGFHQDSIQTLSSTTNRLGQTTRDTLDFFMDIPPGRMPGGGSTGLMFNGNLVWDIEPFRVKIGGSWSQTRSAQGFNSIQTLAAITERGRKRLTNNYMGYISLTHTINPSMFYTLNLSYANNGLESGDLIMGWGKEDWVNWGDPALNPGLGDTSQVRGNYLTPFDPSFYISPWDTPYNSYWKAREERYTIKFDLTKQFGKRHEVKLGGEYSYGESRWFTFLARDYMWRLREVALHPEHYSEYDIYEPLYHSIGYDWNGNPIEDDMIVSTKFGLPGAVDINIRNAPARPKYGAFYIQDRIELRDLILNAGVRYDYMNNGHPSWAKLDSLTRGPGGVIADENWRPPKTYHHLSPRIGFSFPVAERSVFHAQFGKYIQAPTLDQTWSRQAYNDLLDLLYSGVYYSNMINPNLKPERTTSYEFGFQMQFGDNASIDVTAFYKDTRDLLTLRPVLPKISEYAARICYANGDFGTIKGITATFNLRRTSRFQARINYTYSHAEGTGSSSSEHWQIAWQEDDPHFPRITAPLTYDQRHKGTVVLDARTEPTDGPEFFGGHPLGSVGLNLKFDFHSGSPYTRIAVSDAYSVVYGFPGAPPEESPNASTLPWFYQLDAKLDKTFEIGPVRLNVYLWAINLLGIKGIVDAFPQTGRPDTDGWFDTDAGKARINSMSTDYDRDYTEDYIKWYQALLTKCGAFGWQTPRQIRFGVRMEL